VPDIRIEYIGIDWFCVAHANKSYPSAQTRPASLGQSLPRLGRSPVALKNRLRPVVVWPYFDNDGIAVELRP